MGKSIRTTSNTQTPTNSTPAHQALNGSHDDGLSIVQTNQRNVIDLTRADDKDVIAISSHELSNILCDISGAADALNDVGYLLGLIYYGKIEGEAVKSMARLAHDATNTWEDILRTQLDIINEPLAMTGYNKVGEQ